jgi:hemolysin activation/secretion protein
MAIALPPPIPPQPAAPYELRAEAKDEIVIEYQGTNIHVFGEHLADPERLREVVAAAPSISDAVRAIGYLHYVSGYPATLVSYAVTSSDDLHVRVVAGRVKAVTGPGYLLPYFEDLKGKATLTDRAFEADRALADAHAERAGESFQTFLHPLGGADVALELGSATASGKQTRAALTLNNYGNRYAGPYLATAGLGHSFSSGDEIVVSGIASVDLGGSRYQPYWEGDGNWSRVTRYGVFAIDGRYADFRQAVQAYELDGRLSAVAASWLYPLYSDFRQRFTLQTKLEHDDASIDAPPVASNVLLDLLRLLGLELGPAAPDKLLSERYESVELALGYALRLQLGKHQTELQASLAARKGFGSDSSTETTANLGYFLWRPSFRIRYDVTPHWSAIAEGRFQFSSDALPQLEQFVIGGPATLHAYEAGTGIGDEGLSGRFAVEWKGDADSWSERHGIHPRGFVEYGSAELSRPNLGIENGRVEVADVGLELEFKLLSWLHGGVSLAQSIYSDGEEFSPDGLSEQSVFFQLAAKY